MSTEDFDREHIAELKEKMEALDYDIKKLNQNDLNWLMHYMRKYWLN